jgi:preprotein translocase subunit SecG
MGTFISILIFIAAILLILIVLVQNPKGGLAANFSSSNQVMGVRRTSDFLEKATWTLGIALVVLSIASASFNQQNVVEVVDNESELINEVQSIADPIQAPPVQSIAPNPQAAPPIEEGSEE